MGTPCELLRRVACSPQWLCLCRALAVPGSRVSPSSHLLSSDFGQRLSWLPGRLAVGAHPPLTSLLQTHLPPGELTDTREFQYLLSVDTQEAGRTPQARPAPSMQCCRLGKPRAQAPSLKRAELSSEMGKQWSPLSTQPPSDSGVCVCGGGQLATCPRGLAVTGAVSAGFYSVSPLGPESSVCFLWGI